MEKTPVTQSPEFDPATVGVEFVIKGVLSEETANQLLALDPEIRASLASYLEDLHRDGLPEGQASRARLLAGHLGKASTNREVFMQIVTDRPKIVPGTGLGRRPWTNGLHSSPNTFRA